MRSGDRTWDIDLIEDMFNERDRRCILQIQISPRWEEDVMYWSKEVSGNYSVRSAYKLIQVQKGRWNDSHIDGGVE